jgi:hypothetical protein
MLTNRYVTGSTGDGARTQCGGVDGAGPALSGVEGLHAIQGPGTNSTNDTTAKQIGVWSCSWLRGVDPAVPGATACRQQQQQPQKLEPTTVSGASTAVRRSCHERCDHFKCMCATHVHASWVCCSSACHHLEASCTQALPEHDDTAVHCRRFGHSPNSHYSDVSAAPRGLCCARMDV